MLVSTANTRGPGTNLVRTVHKPQVHSHQGPRTQAVGPVRGDGDGGLPGRGLVQDDQWTGAPRAAWGLRCSGPRPCPAGVPGEGAQNLRAASSWPAGHTWTQKQDGVTPFLLKFSPSYSVIDLLVLRIHSGSQWPEVVLGKTETI